MTTYKDFKFKKDERFKDVNYLNIKEYQWNKNIDANKVNKIFDNLKEPIVIRNYYNSNAVKEWTEQNIGDIFKNIEFPIEVYTSNTSYYNGNKINLDKSMTVSKYMEYMKNRNTPPYYYLAEVDLFEKINNTDMPLNILTDTYNENEDRQHHVSESLYLGYNTTSGCHIHIEDDFVLNQIIGKKEIILFDYHSNDEYITRKNLFAESPNFIVEDFFELDHNKLQKLHKVILNPGDSLFIPPWWYHTVRCDDFSCSITKIYTRSNHQYIWEPVFKLHLFLSYCIKVLETLFFSEDLDNRTDTKKDLSVKNYTISILLSIILFLLLYIIFFK